MKQKVKQKSIGNSITASVSAQHLRNNVNFCAAKHGVSYFAAVPTVAFQRNMKRYTGYYHALYSVIGLTEANGCAC